MKRFLIVHFRVIAITIAWHFAMIDWLVVAEDWPMLGRNGTRNGVSTETNAPTEWSVELREGDRVIRESRGILWSAPLGSETHSSPVVSDGLVWIGTNNEQLGHKAFAELHSVLKCFRVADGELVYEYISPRLGTRIQDAGWTGLGSSPLIEGDRLWLTTNRSEVLCWDIGPVIRGEGTPRELWKLDLIKTFDTFPHVPLMGPSRPCSIGASWNGRIFVTTNNGVSEDRTTVPKPNAANVVCLNKETGEVYWQDSSPGANILLTQLSSPTVAEIGGETQVIVPQSDGWVRSFDPMTGAKLWEFDINAKESVYSFTRSKRLSLLGNAVVYEDRVYLASGLDVEQGDGPGRLVCIDPTKRGDVSPELAVDENGTLLPERRVQAVNVAAGEKAIPNPNSGLVWEFISCGKEFEDQMHRTIGSAAIANGLLIVSDYSGMVHCLDARTGQRHWSFDTSASIWASPLIVDDKVYVADEDGEVAIFGLSADPAVAFRKEEVETLPLAEISMDSSICGSPVFANGVLYIARRNRLFAIVGDKDPLDPEWTAGNWPQWRGPNRDNISADTGLLKEWPKAGPPLVWRLKGLGDGISPVSIVGGRVFALSQYENMEFVRAIDERSGAELWTVLLGATVRQSPLMRWYTQRPPTVDGDLVYAVSLSGDLTCLRAATGKELWRKEYAAEFAGKPTVFGFADCPVVEGDKLICTPGGAESTVIALDKKTGAVIWKSALPDTGKFTFGNGVVVTFGGRRQFITHLESALVGIDVNDGKLLWRYDGAVDRAHTPLVRNRFIAGLNYRGPGYRLLELKERNGGFVADEVFAKSLGGFSGILDDTVIQQDRLYEPNQGIFSCFDWKNGTVVWRTRIGPMFTATMADGHFYFHATDGQMFLVEPGVTEPVVKSTFALPDHREAMGTTTPIVTGGRLYVREDEQLFCYDVRAESPAQPLIEPRTISLAEPPAKLLNEHRERILRSVFVPTPQDVVEKMLKMAEVKKTDVVYDLGSGDGRIVITAAAKYGCQAIGYELDRELVEASRTKAEAAGVTSLVTIELKDLFTADLREADVLAVYLLPQQLEKLLPQLEKMKPGSRIISHQFEIPGVSADGVVISESLEDGAKHTFYLWTLPLKKAAE